MVLVAAAGAAGGAAAAGGKLAVAVHPAGRHVHVHAQVRQLCAAPLLAVAPHLIGTLAPAAVQQLSLQQVPQLHSSSASIAEWTAVAQAAELQGQKDHRLCHRQQSTAAAPLLP